MPDAGDGVEVWAQVGTRITRAGPGDVHVLVRGERVTGLAPGEDAMGLGAERDDHVYGAGLLLRC